VDHYIYANKVLWTISCCVNKFDDGQRKTAVGEILIIEVIISLSAKFLEEDICIYLM